MNRYSERWFDGWGDFFRMALGVGLTLVAPGLIAMPYYLAVEAFSEPVWMPDPRWAWLAAIVVTGPYFASVATRAFWPSRAG